MFAGGLAGVAGVRVIDRLLGRQVGASTGTNVWGALSLVAELRAAGSQGSVVSLICDSGDRYRSTIGDPGWLAANDLDPAPFEATLGQFLDTGTWAPPG